MAKVIGKTDEGKDIYGLDFDISVKKVKETHDGRRIFSMIGSTPSIDRDGDTINQKGWVTKYYKKNPVVQWAHDHKIPVIAKVNNFSIDGALRFDEIEFPKEGIHPFADMIASLMEGGFIKSGSVGFMPIKSEKREMTDKEKENEPDYLCPPVNFQKQELLEYSICNVGSNRDALVTHLGRKGFKTSGKVKIAGQEFEIKQLIDALFVEEKQVIPFKHYPLDPEDAAWSGPSERASTSVDDLKLISTWVDPEKEDVKGGYKLPHHRAGNHNTVWGGVRAAMVALLGARGGVDIPENERSGVYQHLKSHYVEFDKEVPEFKEYTGLEMKELFPSLHTSGIFKYEEHEINWDDKENQNCTDCDIEMDEEKSVEITKDMAEKPFKNEHSCRLKSPEQFDSFRRQNNAGQHEGKRIDFIFGIKEGKSELQAMRYPKSIWTASSARFHCASKKGSFEAAIKYVEIVRDPESDALTLKIADSFKELFGKDVRLAWKSESIERCFEASLQSYDDDKGKWFNVEVITIQESQEKAGAVLSKTNKNKLKQAQSLIGEVLIASEPVEMVTENEPDDNSQPPEKGLKEILDRIGSMEKAIDAIAASRTEKDDDTVDDDDNVVIEDEKEIEIEIEETTSSEKEIDLDEVEEEDELDLKDIAQVIGEAIKPMAKELIKTELRTVTGKID